LRQALLGLRRAAAGEGVGGPAGEHQRAGVGIGVLAPWTTPNVMELSERPMQATPLLEATPTKDHDSLKLRQSSA
jgi:hypothetical protein